MTTIASTSSRDDIVEACWRDLAVRTRDILELRLQGFTLEEIGQDLQITRERVRQLEKKGRNAMKLGISAVLPGLAPQLNLLTDNFGAFHIGHAQEAAETECSPGLEVFLQAIGCQRFQAGGRHFPGWWTKDPTIILRSVEALIDDVPFKSTELADRSSSVTFPEGFPIELAMKSPGTGIMQDKNGDWIRRSSKSADSAYLWLSERVEPAAAEEIAVAIGAVSARALTEVMRRNEDRFTQIRPEGTWALREWNHVNGTTYKDATEAVLDVLHDMGPLTLQQLTAETLRRYPVTPWRVGQCISSSEVGETENGRYDLVRRGATPVSPREPVRPEYMAESGNKVAVRLPVNNDVLRGSGIGVNLWLTWKLGLHTYPSQLDFDARNTLTVRRHSSGASLSSLRAFTQELGLKQGCSIIVILDTHTLVAKLRHGCGTKCSNGVT